MATATKLEKQFIRVDKQSLFNALKTNFPALFGAKVWLDVEEFLIEDPKDTTNLLITFIEEPAD